MLINNAAYNIETSYNGPFVITKCCTNGISSLQRGAIRIRYKSRRIKPYIFDTKIEDIKC